MLARDRWTVNNKRVHPKPFVSIKGSEFISRDLDLGTYQRDVIVDFSRPTKQTDDSFIEPFKAKLAYRAGDDKNCV